MGKLVLFARQVSSKQQNQKARVAQKQRALLLAGARFQPLSRHRIARLRRNVAAARRSTAIGERDDSPPTLVSSANG